MLDSKMVLAGSAMVFCVFVLFQPLPALDTGKTTETNTGPLNNPFFVFDNGLGGAIHKDLDALRKQLDMVKQNGFDGISWRFGRGQVKYDIHHLLTELDKRNLKLYAVYTGGMLTETGITEPDGLEDLFKAMKGRPDAQVWYYLYSKPFKRSDPAGDKVAVPALQKLADKAAKYGVTITMYPHIGCWHEHFEDCIRVANQVDRPNFGITFNLSHCLQLGGEAKILEMLEKAGKRLTVVTINGADTNAAGQGWGRLLKPLDEGTYDLKPLLRKLKQINYKGPIGVQCYAIKVPTDELLKRTMTQWRKLNKELWQ